MLSEGVNLITISNAKTTKMPMALVRITSLMKRFMSELEIDEFLILASEEYRPHEKHGINDVAKPTTVNNTFHTLQPVFSTAVKPFYCQHDSHRKHLPLRKNLIHCRQRLEVKHIPKK